MPVAVASGRCAYLLTAYLVVRVRLQEPEKRKSVLDLMHEKDNFSDDEEDEHEHDDFTDDEVCDADHCDRDYACLPFDSCHTDVLLLPVPASLIIIRESTQTSLTATMGDHGWW